MITVTYPNGAPKKEIRALKRIAGSRGATTLRRDPLLPNELWAEAIDPDQLLAVSLRLPGASVSGAGPDETAWTARLSEIDGERVEARAWPPPRDFDLPVGRVRVPVPRRTLSAAAALVSHAGSDPVAPDLVGVWIDPVSGACWATDGGRAAVPSSLEIPSEARGRAERVPATLLRALEPLLPDDAEVRVGRGAEHGGETLGVLEACAASGGILVQAAWLDPGFGSPWGRAGQAPRVLDHVLGLGLTSAPARADRPSAAALREIRRAERARLVLGDRGGGPRLLVETEGTVVGDVEVDSYRLARLPAEIDGRALADALDLVGEVRELRASADPATPVVIVGTTAAAILMLLRPEGSS